MPKHIGESYSLRNSILLNLMFWAIALATAITIWVT
jgi:hypothetical protein